MGEFAAQLFWGALAGQLSDQRVFYGRYPAAHPLAALQQREPLRGGQRLEVQPGHPVQRGVQGIKGRRDRLPIDNLAGTHTAKLTEPTDKKRHPETTETAVVQVI